MHWQQDLKDANPPNLDTTGSRAVRVDCCTAVVTDWNDSLGKPFTKRSCRHDNRHKDWEVLAQTAHRSDLTVEAARNAMWRAHFALETRKVHYLSGCYPSVRHTTHTWMERVMGWMDLGKPSKRGDLLTQCALLWCSHFLQIFKWGSYGLWYVDLLVAILRRTATMAERDQLRLSIH